MKEAQRKFINNNKLSYKFEDNVHVLSNCWGDSSFAFHFDDDTKFDVLENIYFPDNLYAIYHSDKLKYEFIFQPILSNSVLIGRSFDFIYKGNVFKASYGDPTSEFKLLADAFVDNLLEMDDNRSCRNFKYFVDYYQSVKNQILNTEYSTIVPINFFIQGPFNMLEESELFVFFKHVNFYMAFFDRKSPWIFIDNHSKNYETYKVPCLFNINKEFPSQINATPINSDLLDLFSIARSAYTPRLQYLFYFQVLEFAAYYYIEHEFTNKIKGIIKNPDLLLQIDKYSKELIDELQNKYYKNNSDSARLEKVITRYCSYNKIRHELRENKEYFMTDVEFEGGFKLKKIFDKEGQIESELPNIMRTIKDNIEKIRNVLVHVRECHENKVILPTPQNDALIKPYLYLLRRIAEEVAIKQEILS